MELRVGWIDDEVRAEFPQLRLVSTRLAKAQRVNGRVLADRLGELSSRLRGAQAIGMRQTPIAHSYRVLYRHLGMDPDTDRPPAEAAVVRRLLDGAFRSQGPIEDALLITLVETGIAVWAADAASLTGELGIRGAQTDELEGRRADGPHRAGELVVADERAAVSRLFGKLASRFEARAGSSEVVLFSVQAPGVPDIYIDEALAESATMLQAG